MGKQQVCPEEMYLEIPNKCSQNLTTPNPPRGTLFGKKTQHCYFHLYKWGKITTWPQVVNMKDQRKCTVHFENKGMLPKVHWKIQEGS